tara:strand:- start:6539 stop:6817 length:279 start_codon:yes stop_codon:yes gene_type:complete
MSKRWLLILCTLLLPGSRLDVFVGEGGIVRSLSSGTCVTNTSCSHVVADTNYTETFTAIPDTGWHFLKWKSGGNFLCDGSTNPVCVVGNVPF